MARALSITWVAGACLLAPMGFAPQTASAEPVYDTTREPVSVHNPLIARYDGGEITLHELEIYTREMPLAQRIPFAKAAGAWREYMGGQLAKMTALTSQAKSMGLQNAPGYLRARDYFINEYMDYLVLRSEVQAKTDLSPSLQSEEYQTHKQDFYLSPTVSLRMIRTRDMDKISSAAKALAGGADFVTLEKEVSQVSPRYRGDVLGPFPSLEEKAGIPPPEQVIAAAMAIDEGKTTGPFSVGAFHYLVKTVKKTAGRQQTQMEVLDQIEQRLRQREGEKLIPALVARVQTDLKVQVDENLFASASTNPNDVLATVGTVRITRKEYMDLNGNVRGPAAAIATNMPTKLKGFILPYMFSEWGKSRGYLDWPETKQALYYYDLQHLSANVAMELGSQVMPLPTDDELRAKFEKNIESYKNPGNPNPRFEDHKQDMLNVIIQARAPEMEKRVTEVVLQKLNFVMLPDPKCAEITALEAVSKAADRLSSGVKFLEIRSKMPSGKTPYVEIGRAPAWAFTIANADGTTATFDVSGPAPLLHGKADYANVGAMKPWVGIWRFDTVALKRHAIDKALGDFRAKYKNDITVQTRVKFVYNDDAPTSPTSCKIIYEATPVNSAVSDAYAVKYDGHSGDVVQQIYGKTQSEER